MKPDNIFRLRALPLLMLCSAALVSCDDDFQYPPVVVPQATMTANTTIAELKSLYWDTEAGDTWSTQIGTNAAGDSMIISGTILSSDRAGNIYKNLMVRCDGGQGEAVTFAVNKETGDSLLCRAHKPGQRIFINVTGLYIGKYNGYMEIGEPSTQYGITYMPRADFDARSQVDGMPEAGQPQPILTTIPDLDEAKKSAEGLMQWQSQLIRLDGVKFVQGGKATFGDNGNYGDRQITDASGNKIIVRSSGKGDFGYTTLPTGTGSLVGILGYYRGTWQILLNGIDRTTDLIGFNWGSSSDEPSQGAGDGSADKPYTVADVNAGATGTGKWVTGYIVGWVDGKSYDEGARFDANATANTNILLAPTASETDLSACIPVQLQGKLRDDLGLMAHPDNLGKQVSIRGNLEAFFGRAGLKTTDAYAWGPKGEETVTPPVPSGNLTFTKATEITAGKRYILVYDGKVAIPIKETFSYGYLYVEDPVSAYGSNITTTAANAITIGAADGGYTLLDCYGRYLSMDDNDAHKSFQLYNDVQPGSIWTATIDPSGTATFANALRAGFEIRWAESYKNLAPSTDGTSPLPELYVITE